MAIISYLPSGKVIAPNGGTLVFGKSYDEEQQTVLEVKSENYNIVIVEDDTDETIPGEQVSYYSNSGLISTNVQSAISELKTYVDNSVPVFKIFTIQAGDNQSSFELEEGFDGNSLLVYYNGLFVNSGIHYNINNGFLTLLDFTSNNGDIITVINLSPATA